MNLEKVVPWGRSFAEYQRMFALAQGDLGKDILGCGDGPASFNAVLTRRGGRVVSCDPLYECSAADISRRIKETRDIILEGVNRNLQGFIWGRDTFTSSEELLRVRLTAMGEFLADFPAGKKQGRYVAAELPSLPFSDRQFDLALCSHFLFLYSEQLAADFHLASVRELCRVAREVRIFPLLDLGGRPSSHLEGVVAGMQQTGHQVTIRRVPYEFQRGAHQMLEIVSGSARSPFPEQE
jgi:SAM-dependent methyltransferase